MNVAPLSFELSTKILPLFASIILWHIAKPNLMPLALVVKRVEKVLSRAPTSENIVYDVFAISPNLN